MENRTPIWEVEIEEAVWRFYEDGAVEFLDLSAGVYELFAAAELAQ